MNAFTEKRFQLLHSLGPGEKNRVVCEIKDHLLQYKDIVFPCVHGSFVNSDKFRDIDIAVFTSAEQDFYFESDRSYELSSLTGFDSEVRIINKAPVAFQREVIKDGLLLFSRDEDVWTDVIEALHRNIQPGSPLSCHDIIPYPKKREDEAVW